MLCWSSEILNFFKQYWKLSLFHISFSTTVLCWSSEIRTWEKRKQRVAHKVNTIRQVGEQQKCVAILHFHYYLHLPTYSLFLGQTKVFKLHFIINPEPFWRCIKCNVYRTRPIITCSLHIFCLIFHCRLYSRAINITENLCTKQGNPSIKSSVYNQEWVLLACVPYLDFSLNG